MKKLTADKFEKNQVYRNTIDQISQYANNISNGSNTSNSQKPWKNNGCEEFSDCVNQQAINMNNKLLSENQAFRNTLIQLNNDLNFFIKQAKEEYIRKKIKEEGDKDENLKEYYKQSLPDIDLIYFKDDCLNLPYERVGALVLDIFKENFKVVKLFLASISSLLYSHNYYHELGKELDKIKENLMKIRSNIDVTKILFTEKFHSLPTYQIEGFESNSNNTNQALNQKKYNFEIKDFSESCNQNEQNQYQSQINNNRSQSSNNQNGKGALTIINNSNINNNTNNKQTPNSKYSSSVSRNTSQNKQITTIQNEKQKPVINKQNTISNNNNNNSSSQNGLNFKKDQSQIQQKTTNQEAGDEKLFNSAKIEQMIREKLNARLKGTLLPSQNSGTETNKSSNHQINNNNNSKNSNNPNLNKQLNLKNNLSSERFQANDLETYFQNLKNENFISNFEHDKSNNNDLSLSFVSRVSFHDVTCGAEFDEKMIEGLGATPRNMLKGSSDPKQMQQELKRWQTILNSSSEANLNAHPNSNNQQQNEINTELLLKNINQGQQLQTLGGVDINNRKYNMN